MAQPESGRNTAGIGDPTPTGEIPLSERGLRTDSLMYSLRTKTLARTPEFQNALAKSYFNPRGKHNPNIYFQTGRSGYSVSYTSSSHEESTGAHDEQRERFALERADFGVDGGVRILLEIIKHDGVTTYAQAEFRGYDTHGDLYSKHPSEVAINTQAAFEKIEEALDKFKPAETQPAE